MCAAIRALPVPVVAQLHGAVIGAGLEIAAACDLRVAAAGTKFAMPEVRLGIPSVVEAALLPRLMGAGRAAWLVLTGESIDAQPRSTGAWSRRWAAMKPSESLWKACAPGTARRCACRRGFAALGRRRR